MKYKAVSLFSSAGIGELGLKENDIDILLSNELLLDRTAIHIANYPETEHIVGDIWDKKDEIIRKSKQKIGDKELDLLYATPPCQGMSSTGAGKLLSEIKKGKRKKLDERNRLIIPTIDIILELMPKWIIFENVENMKNTIIKDEDGKYVNIIEYMKQRLEPYYMGGPNTVNCSDFSIPQSRKRLITIFTRTEKGLTYFSHNHVFLNDDDKTSKNSPITVRDAIGDLPPLEAVKGKNCRLDVHPFYEVPIMSEQRLFWVSNTKLGDSAFNNQCVNEDCLYQGNRVHGSNVIDGTHKSKSDTPLYCERCGSLLPRPAVIDKDSGKLRLIKGYDTTYARMNWDKPSVTLTQNFQYDSSGRHYHPDQNRILSIYEGLILQTITDYSFTFMINKKKIKRTTMAEIIGESVPPKLIDIICKKILSIENE